MENVELYPSLARTVAALTQEFRTIPAARRQRLAQLAAYVRSQPPGQAKLNFICTHNSRRSHLGMIWAVVAANHYGLLVSSFSGGTEATAFNPRAVAALERAGFRVRNPGGANPHYEVSFAQNQPALICFSKRYDDPVNPDKQFAAVMTCSEADEACPLIVGTDLRLPLTYEDPKEADDTPQERLRYDERVAQIGRELLYAFSLV